MKFETGKIYGDHAVMYEIISRTQKTVIVQRIHHIGRANERREEPERKKIFSWPSGEVFFMHYETVTSY